MSISRGFFARARWSALAVLVAGHSLAGLQASQPVPPYWGATNGEGPHLHQPKIVCGSLANSNGSTPAPADIQFTARLSARSGEILVQTNLGCSVETLPNGALGYQIELSAFPSGWATNETLVVEVRNTANRQLKTAQITANSQPFQLLDIQLQANHNADTDANWRISLMELTRVIELYNFRANGQRTGEYHPQSAPPTEDGFAPGPGSQSGPAHSADTDANRRISLMELTRIIELYNFRTNGQRTGEYHPQSGTEDGFAPGPAAP